MIISIVEKLSSNKKAMDLVRKMDPLGIVRVLAIDCGLSPKDASKVALDLIKKSEGLGGPSIETNKDFPVPARIKKPRPKNEAGGSMLGRAFGKTSFVPGPPSVVRYHFPPDAETEPEEWPFDDQTVAGMNPKNRAPKRGLTASKKHGNSDTRYHLKKGPFDPDMRLRQPGGDGAGGGGIYSKSFHTSTGDMPGAGNSTWVARGTKGWNSMPGKEFDTPPPPNRKRRPVGEAERHPPNAGDNDGEPSFLKQPNTGATSSVSFLGFGGRTPIRLSKAGYRGYGRK